MSAYNKSQNILKPVFEKLQEGELDTSCSLISKVLENNLDDECVKCTYHAIVFWKEKFNTSSMYSSQFERGEYLFSQWTPFLTYMERFEGKYDFVLYALKMCMFNIIIDFYTLSLTINSQSDKARVYRKIGLCYKVLGNYKKAVEFLKYASSLSNISSVLAELADSYAMCGDERLAKVYFREAFFKDALSVEIDFLESDVIRGVIDKLEGMGFREKELLAWVPVYAVLGGLFSVKRQLKAVEVAHLKQDIFLLETNIREKNNENAQFEVPHLINSYFWLIDHYSQDISNKAKIDEVLLKIKLLNEDVYYNYIR